MQNKIDNLLENKNFMFVFAHPDDEIYSCHLIHRLITEGKSVHAVYVVHDPDRADIRTLEAHASYRKIGVPKKDIFFLKIPSKKMCLNFRNIYNLLIGHASKLKIDCIISHDFEGGHEEHDSVSFCAQKVVTELGINSFYVFPAYHNKPNERKGAMFASRKKHEVRIKLGPKGKSLKHDLFKIYESQKYHFQNLMKSHKSYKRLLFDRELLRKIEEPINYKERPNAIVGYEFHRNGFKFDDFLDAIRLYETNG